MDEDASDGGDEAHLTGREAAKACKGKRKVDEVKDCISKLSYSRNKIAEITKTLRNVKR